MSTSPWNPFSEPKLAKFEIDKNYCRPTILAWRATGQYDDPVIEYLSDNGLIFIPDYVLEWGQH